eukprot:CAMPEP_0197620990 /NCGR_PEP_ID=MMETSP1338-20131121/1661_1 /TAXON_ID=43686 ORGANISM="Pelagodinium beii, Strain RCC1491" /NCGR_SAMPLE_ID=MMETSP1338 /ASSEMBLY_ACC=CAM_ASM_000754 /LENGTH=99 /DNA_ID=CAMNT_0043190309 /DNA_START=57 /DNA_END=356 /DNA_ORIENTATION=-
MGCQGSKNVTAPANDSKADAASNGAASMHTETEVLKTASEVQSDVKEPEPIPPDTDAEIENYTISTMDPEELLGRTPRLDKLEGPEGWWSSLGLTCCMA